MTDYYTIQVSTNSTTSLDTAGTDAAYKYSWYEWPTRYQWPTVVYKYQIICPRCKRSNWLELDQVADCVGTKCRAKLKAVSEKADYEIPITANAVA